MDRSEAVFLTEYECEAVLMGLRRMKLTRPPSPASESADEKVSDILRKMHGDMTPPDDADTARAIFSAGMAA